MKVSRCQPVLTIAFVVIGTMAIADAAADQCKLTAANQRGDSFSRGQSLTIELLTFSGITDYTEGPIGELSVAFAEALRSELETTQWFSSIAVLTPESSADTPTDLVLNGEFTEIEGGRRALRMIPVRGGGARTNARVILSSRETGPIAVFSCSREEWGGWFGAGGLAAWEDNRDLLNDNVRKIAESLGGEIPKLSANMDKLATQEQGKNIQARTSGYRADHWKKKPVSEWSAKNANHVLGMFTAAKIRKMGGLDFAALWVASPAYQAIVRTHELIEHGDDSMWLSVRAANLPTAAVERYLDQDLFVISITTGKDSIYWNADDLVASSYLKRDDGEERVAPVDFVDSPFPPLLLAFPTTFADGTPIVANLDEKIELHTQIGARPAVFTFRVDWWKLTDAETLKVRALPPVTQEQKR